MKIKKIIILLISILVPVIITILVALYSYGLIGTWTANQQNFIDDIYEQANTSSQKVETFVKFNSYQYKNIHESVKIYNDYTSSNETTSANENGEFELKHFKMANYVLLGNEEYKKFAYNFYFYDIENNEIDFSKVAVIIIQPADINDLTLLRAEIEEYQEKFVSDNAEDKLSEIYLDNLNKISKNNFFTQGELLEDVDGTAKIVNGNAANRFIYSFVPYNTFNSNQTFAQLQLTGCQFAIFNLEYDADSNPVKAHVLTTGKIENIYNESEDYISNNPDLKEGHGLDTLGAIQKIGYTQYVWPTILWQSAICLVIVGFLGFMFYKSWDFEQQTKKNVYKKKK